MQEGKQGGCRVRETQKALLGEGGCFLASRGPLPRGQVTIKLGDAPVQLLAERVASCRQAPVINST